MFQMYNLKYCNVNELLYISINIEYPNDISKCHIK